MFVPPDWNQFCWTYHSQTHNSSQIEKWRPAGGSAPALVHLKGQTTHKYWEIAELFAEQLSYSLL
jgi:hypothetical protein